MAVTREILNSHPVSNLKKEIAKTNIRGYSKMKKSELVDVMMKNKERFGHIKHHTKAKPAPKAKTPTPKAPTPKPPTPKESAKEYDFEERYRGKLNQFINDIIDLKSNKTNRKVGIKSVRSKLQKYLNTQKKENKSVSDSDIKKFLNQQYPDKDYYEDL